MKYYRAIAAGFCLAGCSVPVVTSDPTQAVSNAFATGTPTAEADIDLEWWADHGDAQLVALLTLAEDNSPDLRSAAAQVMSSRATAGQTRGALLPSVSATASSTASESDTTDFSRSSATLVDASWELAMFAGAGLEASQLRARAEAYDFAGAYVSLAAEVTDSYTTYRACRASETIYRQAVSSQRQTLDATQQLVNAGLSASPDLSLARANVASSEISLRDQSRDCTINMASLATIVGVPVDQVRAILDAGGALPSSSGFRVPSVPADMIRQRPDVAAAELSYAAALREIDVAQSDLYPSLRLGGSVTLSDPQGWSFGPTLTLPVFNGQSRAIVRKANAAALTAGETYRSTVLAAVEETETALARLDAARRNLSSARTMVEEYESYFASVDAEWESGSATLLDREAARRQVQTARLTEIAQRESVIRQWIALYKAMGGGWTRPDLTETTTNGA